VPPPTLSPPLVEIVWLLIGVPSTTNSGCPVPWIVLSPRMTIFDDAPGSPACWLTTMPGALPPAPARGSARSRA
jgi:hypothetical protein